MALRPAEPGNGPVPYWDSDAFQAVLGASEGPFFLYDLRLVEARVGWLRSQLPPEIKIYYAVKANPNPVLLTHMAQWTDGADVSSGGELELVLKAGYRAPDVSFAGPGKTDRELRSALGCRIGSISVESTGELVRLDRIAREMGEVAEISLRINPARLVREFSIKMGGKPSQFGIDEEQAETAFGLLAECKNCRFIGVHVYAGTQCLDSRALIDYFRSTMELVRGLTAKTGRTPARVNFGGGFGVPYHENQEPLDTDSVVADFRRAFTEFREAESVKGVVGILELGRYLVAEAGVYAARIVDVKNSRGKTYCVLEGGMNHHLPASGNFGMVIRKNFKFRNLSKRASFDRREVVLVGPLCTSIDQLGDAVSLPEPEVGDWIGILVSGAYAATASPLLFLSHDPPTERLVLPDGSLLDTGSVLPRGTA